MLHLRNNLLKASNQPDQNHYMDQPVVALPLYAARQVSLHDDSPDENESNFQYHPLKLNTAVLNTFFPNFTDKQVLTLSVLHMKKYMKSLRTF